MNIRIYSDIHIEHYSSEPFSPDLTNVDVIVLAGDVGNKFQGLDWIRRNCGAKPTIYVLGNHEFYREEAPGLIDKVKKEAEDISNVFVLENEKVEIDGVSFLGCTLWSDFKLYNSERESSIIATNSINDFRLIKKSGTYSRLQAKDMKQFNFTSRMWLQDEIRNLQDKKFVVVTHFVPSPESIDPKYNGDPVNPYFASNYHQMISDSGAALWVHGHTHSNFNYNVGLTRVVCNPLGYPGENSKFDPNLTVKI